MYQPVVNLASYHLPDVPSDSKIMYCWIYLIYIDMILYLAIKLTAIMYPISVLYSLQQLNENGCEWILL